MTIPLTRVRAVRGHEPALDGMTLRCRKTGGQLLASVPRPCGPAGSVSSSGAA
ncbi:hypothetical protein [Nonomuraea jiangxiensis]|uniref:hypothetical protein n=1 Tax=Nonomuraea jiangxiensis TaxID=633440 RepID=UPI0015A07EFE|nr:hypothetical protein [Nonomuraea jiangxiensis]